MLKNNHEDYSKRMKIIGRFVNFMNENIGNNDLPQNIEVNEIKITDQYGEKYIITKME